MKNKVISSIWYISKYVAPPGYGTGSLRGFYLIKGLKKYGISPLLITSDANHFIKPPEIKKDYFFTQNDGVEVIWVKTFKYKLSNSIKRIISWIDFEIKLFLCPLKNKKKPDFIIVSSLSILTIFYGLWLRYRFKCKLAFEVRDIWPLTLVEEGKYNRNNPLIIALSFVEFLAYRNSDIVIGTSPKLIDHVKEIAPYQKNVYTIPQGINTNERHPEINSKYIRKYIPTQKFIIGHIGSIGLANALDIFFRSAVLLKERKNIVFLLIGKGDLLNYYKSKYEAYSNIIFAPVIEKKFVNSVIKKIDLLYFSTFPSKRWAYGQSLNKLIDYMYAGRPILGSYSGYPSMINESKCGEFIPADNDELKLANKIVEYSLMSKNKLNEIGLRGKKWLIKNRNFEDLSKNLFEILEKNFYE